MCKYIVKVMYIYVYINRARLALCLPQCRLAYYNADPKSQAIPNNPNKLSNPKTSQITQIQKRKLA